MNTSHITALLLALAALLLSGCGCGDSGDLGAGLSSKVQNLSLSATSACRGSVIKVTYDDLGIPGVAVTDVCADADGDLATTADQYVIARGVVAELGARRELFWDTSGVEVGSYFVIARTQEGGHSAVSVSGPVLVQSGAVKAKVDGGAGGDVVNTVSVRPDCGFYATGTFGAPGATYDAGGPNETSFTTTRNGTYLARYARTGTMLWIADVRVAANASGGASSGASATHPDGGVIATGMYSGSPTITDALGNAAFLPASANQSLWIARFDELGELQWFTTLADQTGPAWSIGIDVASDGTFALCGAFRNNATFGEPSDPNRRVIASAGTKGFVSRWNDDGTLRWVSTASTNGSTGAFNFARRVMHAADNSLLVVGRYEGGELAVEGTATTLPVPLGSRDSFIARYAPDGTVSLLAQVASAAGGWCEAVTLAPLPNGDFGISGQLSGSMTLGGGTAGQVTHDAPSSVDGFIARYDAAGTPLWSRTIGGDATASGTTDGSGIAATPDGELILVGKFVGAASFGLDDQGQPVTALAMDDADAYAARFAADGTLRWLRVDGGLGYDHTCDVKVCPDGCIVASGWTYETMTFDSGGVGEADITSQGSSDGYIYVINGDGGF